MQLKFKHQDFQEYAAMSVVNCFNGQEKNSSNFQWDGKVQKELFNIDAYDQDTIEELVGYKNSKIRLTQQEMLKNIQAVQKNNNIKLSPKLDGLNFTVEMETGTGKTYTYIKTIYELNKHYGWSKFIVVVPSIAIREGIKKGFEITQEHFMEEYGEKIRFFIYDSSKMNEIDIFATNSKITVMIINSQAFNAKDKQSRKIHQKMDNFGSRRPIDVIAQTNPIMIIDEPQSVEGKKTKEAIKEFNPLFFLRYSATHKEEYNMIYRLDALDAYNKKLVKKISVKGITLKDQTATNSYLFLENIEISTNKAPVAILEFEMKLESKIKKQRRKLAEGANLYELSNGLEQYKRYTISKINANNDTVEFINGEVLYVGEAKGIDENSKHLKRIQIRETIKSHIEKEKDLFYKGIKTLTLFFIDEVAKYRIYDENGQRQEGEYSKIFEEEYKSIINDYTSYDSDYSKYLQKIEIHKTHDGYFSIDKKNRLVDPKLKGRGDKKRCDDVDAFDLIMKDKEKLLSFDTDIRFIFSHSALREGWDNPNVFQICTLKDSGSMVRKRQEVGRGLRLCVNQKGERIDSDVPDIKVHDINSLTVIANESYENFAKELQKEISDNIYERPTKLNKDYFLDKTFKNLKNKKIKIDSNKADEIIFDLMANNYIDRSYKPTDKLIEDITNKEIKLPEFLVDFKEQVIQEIQKVYDNTKTVEIEDGRKKNISNLKPNNNFHKKEFQELWKNINSKSVYTVNFDTQELINNSIKEINLRFQISQIMVQVKHGTQKESISEKDFHKKDTMKTLDVDTNPLHYLVEFKQKFDLIGKIEERTKLKRKTIAKILKGISDEKFDLFKKSPEEFILKISNLINEQKACMMIEHIEYNKLDEKYSDDIFTINSVNGRLGDNAKETIKHIQNFLVTDSDTEKKFANDLENSKDVIVYAKLPRGFNISTPVGNYNPDWAIAFNSKKVKHVFFVAETKGSMSSMQLKKIEDAKIKFTKKHFEVVSDGKVKFDFVNSYEKLFQIL